MDYSKHKRYKLLNLNAQDLDGGELQTYNSTTMLTKSGTAGGGKKESSKIT